MASIGEIQNHAYDQPDRESNPGKPREADHHGQRDQNAHDWHKGHPRRFEGPLKLGITTANQPYARADDHECQQRADADHLIQHIDGSEAASAATNVPTVRDEIQGVRNLGDIAEQRRQQSVFFHGEEDTRLSRSMTTMVLLRPMTRRFSPGKLPHRTPVE